MRVALAGGSMGILGGQAPVKGAKGTWEDLACNVNVSPINWLHKHALKRLQNMAFNLTNQVCAFD